jgi:hypothetical protein
MCEGHRRSHWTAGVPGWMRGGGRGWRGGGYRWRGHPSYAYGPEWAGVGPCGFGAWSGEPTAEDELAFLKDEAESLNHHLEGIERRMTELEKASA